MRSVFQHTAPLVLIIAIIGSQQVFVADVKYCTEFFHLDDGSMCTMAMVEGDSAPLNNGNHVLTSSNDCCASIPIDGGNRIAAFVKDSKPLHKSYLVVALLHSIQSQSFPGVAVNYTADSPIHSPPISLQIVESSILLI